MMSQMSHTKTITQTNHMIESPETSHKLDDVMHKILKSQLLGICYNTVDGNWKICIKITDLLGNFFLLLQSNSGAYEDT